MSRLSATSRPINRIDARAERRAEESLERRDRYRASVADDNGRSAPASAASRPLGFTPQGSWDSQFQPQLSMPKTTRPESSVASPTFTPSAPPTISARDGALAASGQTQPVRFSPAPNPSGQSINQLEAANMQYYTGGMGKTAVSPRISAHESLTPTPNREALLDAALSPQPQASPVAQQQPYNQQTARASLYQSHPAIFQAGTPENAAFVSYAQLHGEEAAHKNLSEIMSNPALSRSNTASL